MIFHLIIYCKSTVIYCKSTVIITVNKHVTVNYLFDIIHKQTCLASSKNLPECGKNATMAILVAS